MRDGLAPGRPGLGEESGQMLEPRVPEEVVPLVSNCEKVHKDSFGRSELQFIVGKGGSIH
jgi:hypothetical protein